MKDFDLDNLTETTKTLLSEQDLQKLVALKNPKVLKIVNEFVDLCKPAKVKVITDNPKEIEYVRQGALREGEEEKLTMEGHTIHYDGYYDQARDVGNTAVLIEKGTKLSKVINTKNREEGLNEIFQIMDGVMRGKEVLVRFFCLGPIDSRFSISALQLTDSFYVAHSEDLLYRTGYEEFKRLKDLKISFILFTQRDL